MDTDRLADELLAFSRLIVGHTARVLVRSDIAVTLPQFRMLVLLASRGPSRATDLADELDVQPSTVTRMCDRLVRRELVRRHPCTQDRRATWLVLADPGRDLINLVMHHRRTEIVKLIAKVDVPAAGALATSLGALVAAAGEPADAAWWDQWK